MTFTDPQTRTGFFGWTNILGHPEGFRTTEVSSWSAEPRSGNTVVHMKNGTSLMLPEEAAKRFMEHVIQCVVVRPKPLAEMVEAVEGDY